MSTSLFLFRCLNLGISISELSNINIGLIFDVLEEDIIDEVMKGSKEYSYLNNMDLDEGLEVFLPIG